MIGLPIAFGAGWIIAAPILKRAMRSRITWAGAAFLGGGIALLIALASIVIGRFRGWVQSMNPDTVSQIGGGDKVREIDGLLTAFGWATLAQTTAFLVAGGVLIALMVRALIGPGRAE